MRNYILCNSDGDGRDIVYGLNIILDFQVLSITELFSYNENLHKVSLNLKF